MISGPPAPRSAFCWDGRLRAKRLRDSMTCGALQRPTPLPPSRSVDSTTRQDRADTSRHQMSPSSHGSSSEVPTRLLRPDLHADFMKAASSKTHAELKAIPIRSVAKPMSTSHYQASSMARFHPDVSSGVNKTSSRKRARPDKPPRTIGEIMRTPRRSARSSRHLRFYFSGACPLQHLHTRR